MLPSEPGFDAAALGEICGPPGSMGVSPACMVVGLRPTAGETPALPGDHHSGCLRPARASSVRGADSPARDRLPVHRAESSPAAARAIPHRRRRRWPGESPAVDAIRQGHHRLVSDRRHERQRHRALAHGEVGREHAAPGDDRGPVARTRAAVREGPQGRPIEIVDEPVAVPPDQGEIARRLDEGRLEPRALRPRSAPAGRRATDAEPEAPP